MNESMIISVDQVDKKYFGAIKLHLKKNRIFFNENKGQIIIPSIGRYQQDSINDLIKSLSKIKH